MTDNPKLLPFILTACIILWFFGIAFIQFYFPHNLFINFFIILLYSLLYLGTTKQMIPGVLHKIITFGSFLLTFIGFWLNIINLVLFYARLRNGDQPLFIIAYCIPLAFLYFLFYSILDKSKKSPVQNNPLTALRSITGLIFPIIVFICVFLIALFINSFVPQILLSPDGEGLSGINILINNIALTITFTSLLTYIFEDWLSAASRADLEKVFIVETVIGILLTILLVFSKTR